MSALLTSKHAAQQSFFAESELSLAHSSNCLKVTAVVPYINNQCSKVADK
jgi:hypothetical protein